MQKNLDPDALKELEGNQAKLAGVQGAFASGNLKEGYVIRLSTGTCELSKVPASQR